MPSIKRWIELGTCVAICSALLGCAESANSPDVLVERGHLLESRGQFQQAIDAYTKVLEARPKQATTYYDRGVAFGRLARWKEAADDYTRAIENDPTMAKAFNNRAAAYAHQRQFELAVADLTKAISLDAKSSLAYRNRGLAYHDLGQLGQAIEDYTVSIRLEPTAPESYFERGNAWLESKENQKAIADFDRAITIDATLATAWLNRGEAYRRLGDLAQAQTNFAKAKQLDPAAKIPDIAHSPAAIAAQGPQERGPLRADPLLRRERAVKVAAEFLQSKGFRVNPEPASSPFALLCEKGPRKLRVDVQAPIEGARSLRLTREEIDAAKGSAAQTALLVVEKLTQPSAPGSPYTGGTVAEFVENWKPQSDQLIPVVFEYPLPPRR